MDPTFLIILLVGAAAMFLLSNRSRKQQRQAASFRDNLEVGDEVMTHGGLFGTVVAIDGDVITLESPSGGQTDWLRAAISKLATPPYATPAEDETEDAEEYEEDEEEFQDEELEPREEDAAASSEQRSGDDDADRRA